MTEARELVVPSHFRYREQALLYLPPEMPDPREPDLPRRRLEQIRRVLEITRGRAFCLFTSYAQMRQVHERLLMELGFPLLLQGTAPRKALLEEFRITPNAVLFGTSSFWQGVDVQGEPLSCVIVDRLPFAVPSDPVVAARMRGDRRRRRQRFLRVPGSVGGDHAEAGLWPADPLAEDRGVLMLLDPRLQRQRYGRVFLESLPPYRVTQKISAMWKAFFSADCANDKLSANAGMDANPPNFNSFLTGSLCPCNGVDHASNVPACRVSNPPLHLASSRSPLRRIRSRPIFRFLSRRSR